MPPTTPEKTSYDGHTVLSKNSDAYLSHEFLIDDLKHDAETLQILQADVREKIFTEKGIVCTSPRRGQPSLQQAYFDVATDLIQQELSTHTTLQIDECERTRTLLEGVLSVHMSVEIHENDEREPWKRCEEFRKEIQELEEYCKENKFPSVFPNLMSPDSLHVRLVKNFPLVRRDDYERNIMVYRELLQLFKSHPRYLSAILSVIQRDDGKQRDETLRTQRHLDALQLTEDAMSAQHLNEHTVLRTPLAARYILGLCEAGLYEQVMQTRKKIDGRILRIPEVMQSYILSMLALRKFEDLKSVLYKFPNNRRHNHDGLHNAYHQAYLGIGYFLQKNNRKPEAIAFLEQHAPDQIHNEGPLKNLYQALQKA